MLSAPDRILFQMMTPTAAAPTTAAPIITICSAVADAAVVVADPASQVRHRGLRRTGNWPRTGSFDAAFLLVAAGGRHCPTERLVTRG